MAQRTPPVQSFVVSLLFFGSGCAALIYEVVWFHLLRLVIGGSSLSLGILLAGFMGGMCLGSLCYPRISSIKTHPLKAYAYLEIGIAIFGLSLLWWLPSLSKAYLNWSEASSGDDYLWRSLISGLCLAPPAAMMGATLPAIAKWVESSPEGLARLSYFYGVNTIGAVAGCLCAGFLLMPLTDVQIATAVAAGINLVVAAFAIYLSKKHSYTPAEIDTEHADSAGNGSRIILLGAAASGFTALGSEVIWTRLLSLQFGVTVYAFSIILAVFLAGIGAGSVLGAKMASHLRRPAFHFGLCQILLALGIAYANLIITRVVPAWERPTILSTADAPLLFAHDFMRSAAALLPAAILWGLSFSLAVVAYRQSGVSASRTVAHVYAANTFGAILGSLLAGASMIPLFGVKTSQQVLVAVTVVIGFFLLRHGGDTALASPNQKRSQRRREKRKSQRRPQPNTPGKLALPGAVAVGALAAFFIFPPPVGLMARSRHPQNWDARLEHIYEREGASAPVIVQRHRDDQYLCVAGKVVASNLTDDLRCQRLLGHVPALLHQAPVKTLTVGLGAGTTAGSFCLYPTIEQIDVCEIEPAVRGAAATFSHENHGVVTDPRTHISYDDARHFMATCDEKYDVITSDPIHPWVRGAAALYSQEYYELVKQRLNPGGVVAQWIPLYESDIEVVRCELATFNDAFPNSTYWTSSKNRSQGHDIIAVGRVDHAAINLEELAVKLQKLPDVQQAMSEVGIGKVESLFTKFSGYGPQLVDWLRLAPRNHDLSLQLEYRAGLSLFVQNKNDIYREITENLRYPHHLLEGDLGYRDSLCRSWGITLPADAPASPSE